MMKDKIIVIDSIDLMEKYWCSKSILEMKQFIDNAIEKGATNLKYEVHWGYYDDIDAIDIIAIKESK